jgi:multidrug transporter EmrE-like cation transporter
LQSDRIGLIILTAAIACNAGANVLIKVGMKDQKGLFAGGALRAFLNILTNPWAAAGIASFGIAFVLYSAVLSRLDLSVAYPIMTGAGFVLVLLASILLFREPLNLFRLVGIGSIFFGVALISLKG